MILHGIEYQRPTSLNMRILADHVTYSFLAFMKSIFHFCLGCYCGGYSQNGRSNLSSYHWPTYGLVICLVPGHYSYFFQCWIVRIGHVTLLAITGYEALVCVSHYTSSVNTLRPRQNGPHFTDDIFKCMFVNEKFCILIKDSLKFVPKGPINNNTALIQVVAWRRTGGKPLPWTNAHPVHRRIYAALGGDELIHLLLDQMAAKL